MRIFLHRFLQGSFFVWRETLAHILGIILVSIICIIITILIGYLIIFFFHFSSIS